MRSIGLGMMVVGFLFVQACASEPPRSTSSGMATPPTASPAASPGAGTKSSAAINAEILLNKIKADKKFLVASNMDLTEAEAIKFWPLYDGYQKKLSYINDRLDGTIMDYAKAYKQGPLSDSTAAKLLDEALEVEEAEVALKQDYAQQLGRVLPESKVARYLQIETKIRSILKYEFAREIPLAY